MAILLMYGSHDMRHTGIPQVDGGQRDPRDLGRHNLSEIFYSNLNKIESPTIEDN